MEFNNDEELYNNMLEYYNYHGKNIELEDKTICALCKIKMIEYIDKIECEECGNIQIYELPTEKYRKTHTYSKTTNYNKIMNKLKIENEDKRYLMAVFKKIEKYFYINKNRFKRKNFLSYQLMIYKLLSIKDIGNKYNLKILKNYEKRVEQERILNEILRNINII
jgi:hypothetical protein